MSDKNAIKRLLSVLEDKKEKEGYDDMFFEQRSLAYQKFDDIDLSARDSVNVREKTRQTVNTNFAKELLQRCGNEYLAAIAELKDEKGENNA